MQTQASTRFAALSPQELSLAAAGDSHAFERLYGIHLPHVRGLVYRMAGPKDADDITQDVFVKAWQKLGTFRGEAALSTWLHRVAVNLVIQHFRMAGTRRQKLQDDGVALDAMAGPADRPDRRMQIAAALDELPEGPRRVFILYELEGYTHREIAARLNIATGTSKSHLHRARTLLRKHL